MATLYLHQMWVNHWASGEAVAAYSGIERGHAHAVDGEVVIYAGGRRRSITMDGLATVFAPRLRLLTAAKVETLKGWIGETVQVRDHRGQLFVGVYQGLKLTEYRDPTLWDVEFELHTVTPDEAV